MSFSVDLPETLPIFPLPGALLLPRARLPLHIFEPRYLQMLEDVMKTRARLIGMVQPRSLPPGAEGPDRLGQAGGAGAGPRLNSIGCAGRLTAFSETEDGRYMITLSGLSRFRIRRELPGFAPYRRAEVAWEDFSRDLGPVETLQGFDRPGFFALLGRYLACQRLSSDWGNLREAEDELLINALSMLLPFDTEEKQALLEAPSLTNRRETLVTLIEFALRGGEAERLQ